MEEIQNSNNNRFTESVGNAEEREDNGGKLITITTTPSIIWRILSKKRFWIVIVILSFVIIGLTIAYCTDKEESPNRQQYKKETMYSKYGDLFYTKEKIEEMNYKTNVGRSKSQETSKYKTVCRFSCNDSYTLDGHEEENYSLRNDISYDDDDRGSSGIGSPAGEHGLHNDDMVRSNSTIPILGDEHGFNDEYQFHACCVSWSLLVVPSYATTEDGLSVRVVQLGRMKQAYWGDECRRNNRIDCIGCNCMRSTRRATLLVVNPHDYHEDMEQHGIIPDNSRLAIVLVPGGCKCINNYN